MNARELILSSAPGTNPQIEPVDTGKWGIMHVRVMSGTERDAYEGQVYQNFDEATEQWIRPDNFRSCLLVRTICDASGARLFKDEEIEQVGSADHRLLHALYQKAFEINKLGPSAAEAEKKG
jgi:hypothetical protein